MNFRNLVEKYIYQINYRHVFIKSNFEEILPRFGIEVIAAYYVQFVRTHVFWISSEQLHPPPWWILEPSYQLNLKKRKKYKLIVELPSPKYLIAVTLSLNFRRVTIINVKLDSLIRVQIFVKQVVFALKYLTYYRHSTNYYNTPIYRCKPIPLYVFLHLWEDWKSK